MSSKRCHLFFLLTLAVAGLVACGGPADPSKGGVTLLGALEGAGGPAGFGGEEPISVTVEEDPSIKTTVGDNGSFTLRGLPEGGFTLVFTRGSQLLGTLHFDEVLPNQEITIRVALSANGSSIVLLEEKRNGIGHGEVEIEGRVEAVIALSTEADSKFLIAGHVVMARPGETTIREGNQRRTVNDVTVGRQVHVKGRWLESTTGSGQVVLAKEIKLRGEDDGDGDDDKACMISGGKVGRKIELEGNVASGGGTNFEMKVNGNRAKGLVDVDAADASFKCNGKKGMTSDQCQASVAPGVKVHVSGLLESCDPSDARVVASEVKVQK